MNNSTPPSFGFVPEINQLLMAVFQQYQAGQFKEAVFTLNLILAKEPNCIEALQIRAMLAQKMNQFEQAISDYQKLIHLAPQEPNAYTQIGKIYQKIGDFELSVNYLKHSSKLKPNDFNIEKSLAVSCAKQGKLEQAVKIFDRLLKIKPENIGIQWNRALTLLKAGNFAEGLPGFELRKHSSNFSYYLEQSQPMWDGSALTGKTILIHHGDDGLGDVIQYIRYVPLLTQKGGKVIFAGKKPLLRLLKGVSGISQLVDIDTTLPNFDVYAPLTSLSYYFKTTLETIPNQIPYISLPTLINDRDEIGTLLTQLNSKSQFKIGIVWSGGYQESLDYPSRYLDCPLSLFIDLLSIPNLSLYSLQSGKWAEQINAFPTHDRLYDLSSQVKDLADVATIISHLDLVITVDSAIAHLAGAIDKPVWTLLEFDADWRWLHNRKDTPWYPTMQLFRQQQQGDWQSVFTQLIKPLKQWSKVLCLEKTEPALTLLKNYPYWENSEQN